MDVDDAAAVLLMERFYQNLLGKRPGLERPMPKAAALAEAKKWLRELSSAEAADKWAGLTAGVVRGTGVPALKSGPAPAVQPTDRPFAHPRHWAAFVLLGDPD